MENRLSSKDPLNLGHYTLKLNVSRPQDSQSN